MASHRQSLMASPRLNVGERVSQQSVEDLRIQDSFEADGTLTNTDNRAVVSSTIQPVLPGIKLADLRPSGFLSDPFVHAQTDIVFPDKSILGLFGVLNSPSFWKQQICQILPSQAQCDVLLSYFFEHINWIFQTIHAPTFRAQVSSFWQNNLETSDLVWLSLLLQIVSLSALYIPVEAIELLGIDRSSIRRLAVLWYQASRQALTVGISKSKPQLLQLQVFSVAQLYWYASNDLESLNSNMAQAIRNAQSLELDRDSLSASTLAEEMRHRLWWDLVNSDTFQSMCLGRAPLIRVEFSRVPYPINANDRDLQDGVYAHPLNEPTQYSMNIYRAKFFELINGNICASGIRSHAQTYEQARQLDMQLMTFLEELPWYLNTSLQGKLPELPHDHKFILWQSHILRTCICTQIIRLYQPYLAPSVGNSRARCFTAVEDMLAVYKVLRTDRSHASWQKFFPQAYQIFSMAVTMAALLLVDTATIETTLLDDIMMLASDLDTLEEQGCAVTIASHGSQIVKKILLFAQRREQFTKADSDALAQDISIILGGADAARSYIEQTTPGQNVPSQSLHSTQPLAQGSHTATDMVPFDVDSLDQSLLDPMGTMQNIFDDQFSMTYGTDGVDLLNWDCTGLLSRGFEEFG